MPALAEDAREAATAEATLSPPPAGLATTEAEPTAAVSPPAVVAAALPCAIPIEIGDQPTRKILVRPESMVADVDDPPERFDLELGSRRPRVMALAGVLLLGGIGIAVWATRSGSAPSTGKPVVAARPEPASTSAPSFPAQVAPPAANPVVAPAAQATPTPTPLAASPVAAPAEMASPTAQGSGKLASPRLRPARPAHAAKSTIAVAARPVPRSESPASSLATAVSTPPPAPATADDLVREAQHAWMAGNHAAAISKAQAALKAAPNPAQVAQAYELIATCACALGQADTARAAIAHLGDSKREAVRARCMKNGLTIE
jgi:hypothetical protein